MRVGVFSDSHGDHRALDELLEKMGYIDAACFLGDVTNDAWHLEERLSQMPGHPPMYAVRGNNDLASPFPYERIIELDGVRIYMTHGHIVSSLLGLAYKARESGAQIALFGHTHHALCEYAHDVLLINPGSAGNYCRGGRARASLLQMNKGSFRVENVTI